MAQGNKLLVTEKGTFILSEDKWDDSLFSDLLVKTNPINNDQARDISRSLREEILQMELQTITIPLIEGIVEAKLMEHGINKSNLMKLDGSMFLKKEINFSENAIKVLEKRYLKKDKEGRVIETPEQMFRRVANHIAQAEKIYDNKLHVKDIEDEFYRGLSPHRVPTTLRSRWVSLQARHSPSG